LRTKRADDAIPSPGQKKTIVPIYIVRVRANSPFFQFFFYSTQALSKFADG
jgi:hypothetical protein